MPGLVGIAGTKWDAAEAGRAVGRMRESLVHAAGHGQDRLFRDASVCASRVHSVIQTAPQPLERDGLIIWLDGEIYNCDELKEKYGVAGETDALVMLGLTHAHPELEFLPDLNGVFAAVVYDAPRAKVHLIIDRLGFRHLYWTQAADGLAWSSEYKAFMALPGFEPRIDRQSLQDFLRLDYLLEDRTWFEGVQVLSRGSVLTWDLRAARADIRRYWDWSDIAPVHGPFDICEIADELGRRFEKGVRRQVRTGRRDGLFLSGGLDSRAIFAAMPESEAPIPAITFGQPGCDDIRIAAMAARIRPTDHHVLPVVADKNWLIRRFPALWIIDGQASLLHMHGAPFFEDARRILDVNLSGFMGDATIGGSHLGDPAFSEIERINQRCRRFIMLGIRMQWSWIHARIPFADNDFVELVMGLPAAFRQDAFMYQVMLLRKYDAYFRDIPWQKTGKPIHGVTRPPLFPWQIHQRLNSLRIRIPTLMKRAKDILWRRILRRRESPGAARQLANYDRWLCEEPARTFCQNLLTAPGALYQDYLPRAQVVDTWEKQLSQANQSYLVMRYLTFEIWLQQAFEGRYRTAEEGLERMETEHRSGVQVS